MVFFFCVNERERQACLKGIYIFRFIRCSLLAFHGFYCVDWTYRWLWPARHPVHRRRRRQSPPLTPTTHWWTTPTKTCSCWTIWPSSFSSDLRPPSRWGSNPPVEQRTNCLAQWLPKIPTITQTDVSMLAVVEVGSANSCLPLNDCGAEITSEKRTKYQYTRKQLKPTLSNTYRRRPILSPRCWSACTACPDSVCRCPVRACSTSHPCSAGSHWCPMTGSASSGSLGSIYTHHPIQC